MPSLLLPFTLRNRLVNQGYDAPEPGRLVRSLLWIQAHGTIVIGAGLALTGLAMIAVLGPRMLEQPWLLVSLATYAVTAVIAFGFQRPSLRRLVRRDGIESDARPRGLARPGPPPALHRLCDHDGGGLHRVHDVDQAGPVVIDARPRTAAIVNLGCKVNQSEMEAAARLLREASIPLVDPDRAADLVLVNTCTVTATADEKSRAAVRRARRANPDAEIVVTGCSVAGRTRGVRGRRTPRARLVGNEDKAAFLAELEALLRLEPAAAGRTAPSTAPCRRCPASRRWSPRHRRHRRRPRLGRADPGLREGPGRLLVLLHVLHHPAGPRRRAEPRRPRRVLADVRRALAAGHREIVLTGINIGTYDGGWSERGARGTPRSGAR